MSYPDCYPLVVEDDADYVLILRRILGKLGVPPSQIFVAPDGQAAIDLLGGRSWSPSFVLLDLHMPKRSGLEVLEWIRNCPSMENLPVFILTTGSLPEDLSRAFGLGIVSYFVKPLELADLEGVLGGIVAWWKNHVRRSAIPGHESPTAG